MTRVLLILSALVFAGCLAEDGNDFYEPCADNGDCVAGTECFRVAFERGRDGRMCTDTCSDDVDCPYGGACWGLEGDPVDQRVCFERCFSDRDCPPRFVCADAEMGGVVVDSICLPE